MTKRWRQIGVLFLMLFTVEAWAEAAGPAERRFEIRYAATIPALPGGATSLRIWLPYPRSDAWQTISNVVIDAPSPFRVRREAQYGNSIAYLESPAPPRQGVTLTMTFAVTRREYLNRPDGPRDPAAAHADARLLERFRQPDKLVPLQGRIAELAREVTQGRRTDRDKARAIYDYVTSHLHYDKSGNGWGRGDAVWACDNKRGNCTDFHSLLIGMARSVGIPAKFEIGLPVPADEPEGPIAGYHCWAAFYLEGVGWVPVDSSEASKNPAKRDYFFGALDANRVRLSSGRDLILDPPQQGGPLNYFVYPYVEADGKPLGGVTQTFAFRNVDEGRAGDAAAHSGPKTEIRFPRAPVQSASGGVTAAGMDSPHPSESALQHIASVLGYPSTVGDDDALRIPSEDRTLGAPRSGAVPERQAPLARGASVDSD